MRQRIHFGSRRTARRRLLERAIAVALLTVCAAGTSSWGDATLAPVGGLGTGVGALAALEGDYRLTTEFWPAEGAAPEVTVLPASRKLIHGGRVLQLRVGSDGDGFQGTGLLGSETTDGRFWYVWTDTSTRGVAFFRGELTDTGEGDLAGEAPTPRGATPMRITISHRDGSEVHEYFVPGAEGDERRYLRLRYDRRPR